MTRFAVLVLSGVFALLLVVLWQKADVPTREPVKPDVPTLPLVVLR